jgi:hypothetical protein
MVWYGRGRSDWSRLPFGGGSLPGLGRTVDQRTEVLRVADRSERGVLEPVGEQGLVAEDFHAGGRRREAAGQDQEQVSG